MQSLSACIYLRRRRFFFGGFQSGGGSDVNSKSIVLEPDSNVTFKSEVFFDRYQGGVMFLPALGGKPLPGFSSIDGSLATTVTMYSPEGSPSSRPVFTE